jgi:hypothetical protein
MGKRKTDFRIQLEEETLVEGYRRDGGASFFGRERNGRRLEEDDDGTFLGRLGRARAREGEQMGARPKWLQPKGQREGEARPRREGKKRKG